LAEIIKLFLAYELSKLLENYKKYSFSITVPFFYSFGVGWLKKQYTLKLQCSIRVKNEKIVVSKMKFA